MKECFFMWNTPCNSCSIMQNSIFSKIEKADMTELETKKITTLYVKGQKIFHPGQVPIGVYCLGKGIIKLSKLGENGKEQIVRFAKSGELLGIRALLAGRKYSTTSTALENSMVCFISKRVFFKLCLRYPYISQKIMRSLSHLLEEAEEKMTSLAQRPVRERLAENLIFLSEVFNSNPNECIKENDCDVICMTREDIASIVGTATETVIRILKDFKEENLIEIKGRKIILKNTEGLQKIIKAYS